MIASEQFTRFKIRSIPFSACIHLIPEIHFQWYSFLSFLFCSDRKGAIDNVAQARQPSPNCPQSQPRLAPIVPLPLFTICTTIIVISILALPIVTKYAYLSRWIFIYCPFQAINSDLASSSAVNSDRSDRPVSTSLQASAVGPVFTPYHNKSTQKLEEGSLRCQNFVSVVIPLLSGFG